MRDVSDAFLLQTAEISGGLIGLFLIGVFFYVETGFRRLGPGGGAFEDYFRASTKIVMLLFAIPLVLSLTLVVLEPGWSRVIFVLLCVLLVAANFDTASQMRDVQRVLHSPALYVTEVVGTIGVVILVSIPWILGGLDPTREDLAWSILVSFAIAFISVFALVISVFDVSRAHREARG
jgi:hypothetical protein